MRSKAAVVSIVWIWLAILTLTHLGSKSPYSYGWALFGEKSAYLNGAVVNPDAWPMHWVMMFFYDGLPIDWPNAQNMRLPLHAFSVATLAAFLRSTLLSNYLVNFLFAGLLAVVALNAADRFGIRRSATLITLLTVFSLPMYVEYLGQPLHYVVGTSVSFLVFLSLLFLSSPWLLGLAASILQLNYDPYVWLAALVAYVVIIRFPRRRDWVYFAVAGALPNLIWTQYLRISSGGTMTRHLHQTFVAPVIGAWKIFLLDPIENALLPFVASHVGLHVALHQTISMIRWPLLVVVLYLLVRLRPRVLWLVALLPVFFVLEQMVAAGWDWELNPRRAIPVVFAFGVAYCFAVDRMWDQRRWRIAFIALFVLCALLAMADTIFDKPVMAFLHTGQAMRQPPADAIGIEDWHFSSLKTLMHDQTIVWRDLPPARLARFAPFAFAQLFVALLLIAVFWLCARAALLPRWAPLVVAAVWLASLVARFIG